MGLKGVAAIAAAISLLFAAPSWAQDEDPARGLAAAQATVESFSAQGVFEPIENDMGFASVRHTASNLVCTWDPETPNAIEIRIFGTERAANPGEDVACILRSPLGNSQLYATRYRTPSTLERAMAEQREGLRLAIPAARDYTGPVERSLIWDSFAAAPNQTYWFEERIGGSRRLGMIAVAIDDGWTYNLRYFASLPETMRGDASWALVLRDIAQGPERASAPVVATTSPSEVAQRTIDAARAAEFFETVASENAVIVRHTRSGLECVSSVAAPSVITIFATRVPRGNDVGCTRDEPNVRVALYATRYEPTPPLQDEYELVVAAVLMRNPGATPWAPEMDATVTRSDGSTPDSITGYLRLPNGTVERISLARVGGWSIKMRASLFPGDQELAALGLSVEWGAILDTVQANQATSE